MPIRHCKCSHPYYMHGGAGAGIAAGACHETIKNEKGDREPCTCRSYDHDPASGKF